jgi:hypothetical protein
MKNEIVKIRFRFFHKRPPAQCSRVALLRAPGELGVFMTSASTVMQHHWRRSDHIDLESDH